MSYIKYKMCSWQQSAGERRYIWKRVSAPHLHLQFATRWMIEFRRNLLNEKACDIGHRSSVNKQTGGRKYEVLSIAWRLACVVT
jgi:hypothetical protein